MTGSDELEPPEELHLVEAAPPEPPPPPPGIENGLHVIAKDFYHADPCLRPSLSASIAHTLVAQSPAHAWLSHPRGGGFRTPATEAMRVGTLLDSMLLGGDTPIVRVECNDWRAKGAKAARAAAEAEGKIAVLAKVLDRATKAAERIRARLDAYGLKLDGHNQLSAFWPETAANGETFQARGRLDHLCADGVTVLDLKITADASPAGTRLARQCYEMGYDIQAAAYTRAIETLYPDRAGRVRFFNVWAEATPPYALLVSLPAGSMRELGQRRWRQAVDAWGVGLRTGYWRAYTEPGDAYTRIEAPAWTLDDSGIPAGGSPGVTF